MTTGLVGESGERESLREMLKKITGTEEQKKERKKKGNIILMREIIKYTI